MPTETQIREAKEFLLKRIDAEISAERNIRKYMSDAAMEIVSISVRYRIPPRLFRFSADKNLEMEVDRVLGELKDKIVYATERLSVYDREDDMDGILSFMGMERFGKTFRERDSIYVNRYKYELEAAVAAGMLYGKAKEEISDAIKVNLESPFNNEDIKGSFGKGMAATRIKSRGISYGAGRSNSAYNMIRYLSRNEIASAWMWWYGMDASRNGARGFYSFRGSSYPCALCDDMAGYHRIDEFRYHWHPNCRCFFVFV